MIKIDEELWYIGGPMRGYPEYNFPAFYAAEELLISEGLRVINPARDDEEAGFDRHKPLEEQGFDMRTTMLHDLTRMIGTEDTPGCCGIYLLAGWRRSSGAQGECAIARWANMKIRDQVLEDIFNRKETS